MTKSKKRKIKAHKRKINPAAELLVAPNHWQMNERERTPDDKVNHPSALTPST